MSAGAARKLAGRVAKRLLGITEAEAAFSQRGFAVEPDLVERIERLALAYLGGYYAALEEDLESLGRRLAAVEPAVRSFAYEGAGTGLAALDAISPWPARLRRFLDGPGAHQAYIVHIGAGWAMARMPRLARGTLRRLDPVLRWLAYDGVGFHEGLFATEATLARQRVPRWLAGYARRAFDLGVGRCVWFVEGGEPERVARRIGAFAEDRRGELWSGVGLACAYAGGRDEATLAELARAAGDAGSAGGHRRRLAQGAAFAAASRVREGERAPQTVLAARVLCGLGLEDTAALVGEAGRDLPPEGGAGPPPFEVWRLRVQERLVHGGEA